MSSMSRYYRLKKEGKCVVCGIAEATDGIACKKCADHTRKRHKTYNQEKEYKVASHICPVCKRREKKYKGKCYICYGGWSK